MPPLARADRAAAAPTATSGSRRERLRAGLHLLGAGELLVTDRLHGHIVALLAGVPQVLLDNSYGKLRGFWEAWTHDGRDDARSPTPHRPPAGRGRMRRRLTLILAVAAVAAGRGRRDRLGAEAPRAATASASTATASSTRTATEFTVKGVVAPYGTFAGGNPDGLADRNEERAPQDYARMRELGVNTVKIYVTPYRMLDAALAGSASTASCAPRATRGCS